MPGSERQNSMFKKTRGYVQEGNPFAVTSCGRRRNTGTPIYKKEEFKPHNMYDRQKAQTYQEHLDLKEKGYTHSPYKDSPLEKRKRKRKRKPDVRKTTKGKNRNFRTTKEGAGMTSKGVKAYRRKNPGSKLKTAVTGKVKPGSKAAKRRKSFCARSKGWTGERGRAARRRWKC
jgi:hypothetical protein